MLALHGSCLHRHIWEIHLPTRAKLRNWRNGQKYEYFLGLNDCETAACAVQSSLCCEYGCGGRWRTFDTSWIMDLSRVCAPTARTSHPGATETHTSILPQEASRSSESMAGASNGDPRRTKARHAGDSGEQGIRWPDRWVGKRVLFSCLTYADLILETGNSSMIL